MLLLDVLQEPASYHGGRGGGGGGGGHSDAKLRAVPPGRRDGS